MPETAQLAALNKLPTPVLLTVVIMAILCLLIHYNVD